MRVSARLKYCTTALAGCIFAVCTPAHSQIAQEQGDGTETSEPAAEIVVEGSRFDTTTTEIPGSVTIITSEELSDQLNTASNIDRVLERLVPGMGTASEGIFSANNNGLGPGVRGRPASVLINGVPLNTLLRGNGVDTQLIDPNAIDRIEVKRGASAVFGFGASGGIIQYLTRKAKSDDLEINVKAGADFSGRDVGDSFSYEGYAGLSQRLSNGLDFYVGGGFTKKGSALGTEGQNLGAPEFSTYNFDANLGYALTDNSSLRFTTNFNRRNVARDYINAADLTFFDEDADDFAFPDGVVPGTFYVDPTLESKRGFQKAYIATLSYSNSDVFGSKLDITGFLQKNLFRRPIFESNFETLEDLEFSLLDQLLDNRRIGIRSNMTTDASLFSDNDLELIYGIDWIRDRMTRTFSTGFGSDDRVAINLPGYGDTTYGRNVPQIPLSPPVELTSVAFFAQSQLRLGPVLLSGGLRHERSRASSLGYNSDGFDFPKGTVDKFNATIFNAGVIVDIADSLQLYGGLNQGLELSELGRVVRTLIERELDEGRPVTIEALRQVQLEPSITTEYEIGFRGKTGDLSFELAGFFSNAPLSSRTGAPPGSPPNVILQAIREPTKIWGLEATLDYRVSSKLKFGALFAYQDGKTDAAFDDVDGFVQLDFTRLAPPRLLVFGEWKPFDNFEIDLQATKIFSSSPFPEPPSTIFGDFPGNIKGYMVFDLNTSYQTGFGEFSVGISNLFNKRYLDVANQSFPGTAFDIPDLGRQFTVTYSKTF
jgi:iron complex outermembrane recepter protein